MGGGAVFRSVVRLIGAATAAAVSHPPPERSLCVPCAAVVEYGSEISARKRSYVVQGARSSVSSVDAESMDCDGSSLSKRGKSQLIFSSPPTAEEVEDATRDLHAALYLSLPASGLVPETLSVADGMYENYDDMVSDKQVLMASASRFEAFSDFDELGERKSNVMQAFQLLESNPKVQDVVKSLASDPAVWNAMMSNEKLQEFASHQCFENDQSTDETEHQEETGFSLSKLTSKVYGIVSEKVLNIFRKVMALLNSVYGSVETAFQSKGGFNTSDKTVISCMVLAVAVCLMVYFKRAK